MNEIEKAISEIIGTNYGECQCHRETMVQAVEALREKAERKKGCEYCNTGESLNGYEDVGSFIILPNGKKYYLEITFNRDFYNCTTDINYCPMCGKRLEEHHEAD
jgi:hypothetical protein